MITRTMSNKKQQRHKRRHSHKPAQTHVLSKQHNSSADKHMYTPQQRTWSPLQYTKQQPTLTQDQLEPPLLPPHHCAPSAPLPPSPPSPPPFLRDCVIQGCSPLPYPRPRSTRQSDAVAKQSSKGHGGGAG